MTSLSFNLQDTWAILIGIGKFTRDPALHDIPAVKTNLSKLRNLLTHPEIMGVPPDHIIEIEDAVDIYNTVDSKLEKLPKSPDTLIIYYVGHGLFDPNHLYLATVESKQGKPNSGLEFEKLWELTSKRATNTVYILDCCFSGNALNEGQAHKIPGKNIAVLTASYPNTTARTDKTYTKFTESLIHILETGFGTERTLTTEALRSGLKEQLPMQGLPKPYGNDFFDTLNSLHIAYNRAYKPGGSQAEIAESLMKGYESEIKSKDQLILIKDQRIAELEAKLKRIPSSDPMIQTYQIDAEREIHFEDYVGAGKSLDKASARAIELGEPATAAQFDALNARLNEALGEAKKAAAYHLKVAEMFTTLGKNTDWGERCLKVAVEKLRRARYYQQAIPLQEQVLTWQKRRLGPNCAEVATSLNNLAELYRTQGQYEKALPLYQEALAIQQQVLGPHHPDTATGLNNLALLYQAQGKYAQALPLCQEALAIRKQILGPHHPNTVKSLNNLASLYWRQGEYVQALPLYQEALAIQKQVLGLLHHPDTAQILNNLASLYNYQGEYAHALPLHQEALAIRKQVLGQHHPDTAQSLNNLAWLYSATGDYAQASPLYREALAIAEKVLGEQHPTTQLYKENYQQLLEDMAEPTETPAEPKSEGLLQKLKRWFT